MPEHIDASDCKCWGCIQEWEIRSRARDALSQLVRPIQRFEYVEFGEKVPEEFPLIEQLRSAAEIKGSEGSSASAERSGVPLDLMAVQLLSDVTEQLHDDAVLLLARSVHSNPDPIADGEALLGKVLSLDVECIEHRSEVWRDWTIRIREYLAPTRRTPLQGRCHNPECMSSGRISFDEEGGQITDSALYAVWSDEKVDHVECICCQTLWPRHEIWKVAQALDTEVFKRFLQSA
ncbi:hypothetical protein [uncultured Rothia sp.]|uniref:hypothetical protein n=1 Tax=uncultured Rothia sp. TaxID=316088 RepID=UPI0032178EA7